MTVVHTAAFSLGLRLTQISLRIVGFRHTVRLLGAIPVRFPAAGSQQIHRWIEAIDEATHPPKPPSCLDRSLFLWFVMRLHGFKGDLRIGVSPGDANTIDGHAWVEYEGTVLNDSPDVADRFAVFEGDPIRIVFS